MAGQIRLKPAAGVSDGMHRHGTKDKRLRCSEADGIREHLATTAGMVSKPLKTWEIINPPKDVGGHGIHLEEEGVRREHSSGGDRQGRLWGSQASSGVETKTKLSNIRPKNPDKWGFFRPAA